MPLPLLAAAALATAPAQECRGVPIRTMIGRYAELQRAQDTNAIADLYGTDGVVENPGSKPIRGAAEVRDLLNSFHGFSVKTNVLTVETVTNSGGDWRVTGRFHQTGTMPDAKSYDVGGTFDSRWTCGPAGWQVLRMATGK